MPQLGPKQVLRYGQKHQLQTVTVTPVVADNLSAGYWVMCVTWHFPEALWQPEDAMICDAPSRIRIPG